MTGWLLVKMRGVPGRCGPARTIGYDNVGRTLVSCSGTVHSARVCELVKADGQIRIPAARDAIAAGHLVEFFPLQTH